MAKTRRAVIVYIGVNNSKSIYTDKFRSGDKETMMRQLIGLDKDEYDLAEIEWTTDELGAYEESYNHCDSDVEKEELNGIIKETEDICWWGVTKDYVTTTFCVVIYDTTITEVESFLKNEIKCFDLESAITKFLRKNDDEYDLNGVEITRGVIPCTFNSIFIDVNDTLYVEVNEGGKDERYAFRELSMTEKYAVYGNIIDTEIEL